MKKILFLFTIIIGITSCDDYLDINQDPNSPSSDVVSSGMIFPGVEMNLASSYGNFLRIVGGYYSQHYAHNFGTGNYLDYSEFKMSPTRSSGTYTQLYSRVLNNLESIRQLAEADEEWGTYLAATTLRVFTYQTLVDAYGEVPYFESLNPDILSPAYDDGNVIYEEILKELNAALANATSSSVVCTNFLFGGSTAKDWIPFAKALKLKILMRMSDVKDVSSELAALVADGDFPTTSVSFDDCWADEAGKASPFFQEEYATYFGSTQINVVSNIAYMNTMLGTNDPRVGAFFETNESGKYTGGVSGTNFSTSSSYKSPYFCRPVFTYDMPVYLISVMEIEFFLAEYHARYGTAADAEMHYKAAVDASFAEAGVTGAESVYDTNYPWDNAKYKEIIGVQKWIALGGTNNFESWCEIRRLGFPNFGTISGDDLYDVANDVFEPELYQVGTLYSPINVNTELGSGVLLQRLKYAESSANRNSNTPANKKDNVPVFWAE